MNEGGIDDSQGAMFTSVEEYSKRSIRFVETPLSDQQTRGFSRFLDRRHNEADSTPSDIEDFSDDDIRAGYGFVERVSRWIPANPSRKKIVDKLQETYVPLTNAKRSGFPIANRLLSDCKNASDSPDEYVFDRLLQDDNGHGVILLSGARGVGKTAFLNYWLSKNTRRLESQRKTWFRIDMAKVFNYWKERGGATKDVEALLTRYHRAHMLYVVFVYGGTLASISNAHLFQFDHVSELFRDVMRGLRGHSKYMVAIENLCIEIDKLAGRLPTAQRSQRDISAVVVEQLLDRVNDPIWNDLSLVAVGLAEEFRRRSVRTLILVDGLDNISWSRSSDFYVQSCDATISFIGKQLRSNGCQIVLAVRPETACELQALLESRSPGWNNSGSGQGIAGQVVRWQICIIEAPEPLAVVGRKVAAAIESSAFDDDRSEFVKKAGSDTALSGILSGFSRNFVHCVADIVATVEEDFEQASKPRRGMGAGRKLTRKENESVDRACCRLLFDYDIRAFMDNLFRVMRAREFNIKRNILRATSSSRLVMYMFLNGKSFLDSRLQALKTGSRKDYGERGGVFPNPFYYNPFVGDDAVLTCSPETLT